MQRVKTAILHYSAPPVVGGVEAVMEAHARVLRGGGYPIKVIAGRGDEKALPEGTKLVLIPEIDSQHPHILEINAHLEKGQVPAGFDTMRSRLVNLLEPVLQEVNFLIVHNVFFKHFNLPLTAALFQLLDQKLKQGRAFRWLAWGHDFTWTSPNSRSKVFPGYPWDLLRTAHPGLRYVVVSEQRRRELIALLSLPSEMVEVIYNGVDSRIAYGLSDEGFALIKRMDLLGGDPLLLMPVRVTQAKNIEFAEQVVQCLKRRDYNPRLVITGPPDPHSETSIAYYNSLVQMREEMDLHEEIHFVFEDGPEKGVPYTINQPMVAEFLRVCDVLLMPSHREGFGMPVLEAGLVGMPVVCSEHVPIAQEIGSGRVYRFSDDAAPEAVVDLILDKALNTPTARFRREVRQNFTWQRIFTQQIEPHLKELWEH